MGLLPLTNPRLLDIASNSKKAIRVPETNFRVYELHATLPGNTKHGIGIDPGVNFGLTIIEKELVFIFWGKLPIRKKKGWHGIDAYNFVLDWIPPQGGPAVVEGAAYKSHFGQVGLEEVRFGFFFGLYQRGLDVSIMAPAAVRMTAFGHGRTSAAELWPELNHNAADSVGCALAAIGGT